MKKFIFNSAIGLILLLIANSSCNKTTEDLNDEQHSKVFDIESILDINQTHKDIILTTTSRTKYSSTIPLKDQISFQSSKIVRYTNLPGSSIVVDLNNNSLKSNVETSLIIPLDENNEVITIIHYERTEFDSYYNVKTKIDGVDWFAAKVNLETNEVIEINDFNLKMGFMECVKMAIKSCVGDNECAFICGIVWRYCIGAVAVACAAQAL